MLEPASQRDGAAMSEPPSIKQLKVIILVGASTVAGSAVGKAIASVIGYRILFGFWPPGSF